ncbi:unnamed protein product [Ectocarpus sp. 12 AP-2014]
MKLPVHRALLSSPCLHAYDGVKRQLHTEECATRRNFRDSVSRIPACGYLAERLFKGHHTTAQAVFSAPPPDLTLFLEFTRLIRQPPQAHRATTALGARRGAQHLACLGLPPRKRKPLDS